jgi:hypothetical protein
VIGVDYYILVSNTLGSGERAVKPPAIMEELLPKHLWLLPPGAPFQKAYAAGDRFLIYAGGECNFYAAAECAGPVEIFKPGSESISPDLPGTGGFFGRVLRFRSVVRFREPVPIRPLLDRLSFIKDQRNWGLYLRQSARRISERDFRLVVGLAKS